MYDGSIVFPPNGMRGDLRDASESIGEGCLRFSVKKEYGDCAPASDRFWVAEELLRSGAFLGPVLDPVPVRGIEQCLWDAILSIRGAHLRGAVRALAAEVVGPTSLSDGRDFIRHQSVYTEKVEPKRVFGGFRLICYQRLDGRGRFVGAEVPVGDVRVRDGAMEFSANCRISNSPRVRGTRYGAVLDAWTLGIHKRQTDDVLAWNHMQAAARRHKEDTTSNANITALISVSAVGRSLTHFLPYVGCARPRNVHTSRTPTPYKKIACFRIRKLRIRINVSNFAILGVR